MLYADPVPVKIAYFVSHPIQYQSPLLRRIAQEPDIELTVFYSSDHSVRGYADEGFGGVHVRWDIPLLDGYAHEFLPGLCKRGASGLMTPLSWGIFSRLRHGKFDVVWLHGYHTINALHAMVAAKLLGIPVLLRTDSTLDDRPRGPVRLAAKRVFFAFLRQMVRGVFAVGHKNAEYWRASLGNGLPVFPMPYAVDNDSFRARAAKAASGREDLRRELNFKPRLPVFLFASKFLSRKRCIDLVEAFLRLAPAHGAEPLAYLLIAGDGEERLTIERRIASSGARNIRMLGFQNQTEIPRLFDLCDVFVLPSIHEPWGLIVNEIMNASRAIVLSDQVGCAPDLLRDGVNGFVFPARNVDALSAVLHRFIDDPSLARTMGSHATEIIDEYTFQRDVEGLRQALAFLAPGFTA
ncbi:MAG: glycosyltransferase family 4 protein [Acidobacteriaceae bacterium]